MVDELRDRKSCLQQFLREKENLIDELSNGLRRVLTAISLNCHTSDIVEQEYVYSLPLKEVAGADLSEGSKSYNNNVSSLMGRIVGKGGSNVHGIESQFKVSIDINSLPYASSGDLLDIPVVRFRILVMGNKYQPSIEQAYAALVSKIESVRDTTIEQVIPRLKLKLTCYGPTPLLHNTGGYRLRCIGMSDYEEAQAPV